MREDREYRAGSHAGAVQEGPSLIWILVLINVVALVLQQLYLPDSRDHPGAVSVQVLQRGGWWTLFTHLFVHRDWMHLLINMGLLVLGGRRVLADVGQRHFLYIYLGGGWAAAAATLLLHPDGLLFGASGCVSAVIGAYAALHPERSVTARLGAWAPRLRARNVFFGLLIMTFVMEGLALVTRDQPHSLIHGVAHIAHGTGLLAGWLYARHLATVLSNLYHREEFFPQGMRRRDRERELPIPAGNPPLRRAGSAPVAIAPESPEPAPRQLSNDEFLREAVDPVLDKLYASGMGSLSEAERHILDEAANRFSRGKS